MDHRRPRRIVASAAAVLSLGALAVGFAVATPSSADEDTTPMVQALQAPLSEYPTIQGASAAQAAVASPTHVIAKADVGVIAASDAKARTANGLPADPAKMTKMVTAAIGATNVQVRSHGFVMTAAETTAWEAFSKRLKDTAPALAKYIPTRLSTYSSHKADYDLRRIVVKSTSPAKTAAELKALGMGSDFVTVKQATLSKQALVAAQASVKAKIGANALFTAINPATEKVMVRVTAAYKPTAVTKLAGLPVTIEVGKAPIVKLAGGLGPAGGSSIQLEYLGHPSYLNPCTVSFTGRVADTPNYQRLSAGHCANQTGGWVATDAFTGSLQWWPGAWITGQVYGANPTDALMFAIYPQDTQPVQGWDYIVHIAENPEAYPLDGQWLCQWGADTGQLCGVVDEVYDGQPDRSGDDRGWILPVTGNEAAPDGVGLPGDSGGPVYDTMGEGIGIVHGFDPSCCDWYPGHNVFTRAIYAFQHFGLVYDY